MKTFLLILSVSTASLFSAYAEEQNSQNTLILDEVAVQNLGIQFAIADERNFESTHFALGQLEEIPALRSTLSSRIAGRIVELFAQPGDTVREGQVLAVVESRLSGNPPPRVELRAPSNGTIVSSTLQLGQPVEPEQALLQIVDHGQLWAVAHIPEQDLAQITINSSARLQIPATNKQLTSQLLRFSPESNPQTGTTAAIFPVSNLNLSLRPGMRVEFSIITSSRSQVLSIPREAVQGPPTKRIVFVKDFSLPNAFIKSSVVLGEQNDQYVEVLSGLFPGDEVVTRGAYTLSFSGSNSTMSLKEALDAAHGHEHNEDGSEMTNHHDDEHDEHDHHEHDEHDDHDEHEHHHNGWKLYGIVVTVLLFICIPFLGKSRKN